MIKLSVERIISLFKGVPNNKGAINYNINSVSDITEVIQKISQNENQSYRLWVPVEKVCMHGGFRCNSKLHPFISFLHKGESTLRNFYQTFTPKNITQMYHIEEEGRLGENLPTWELPWIERSVMSPPRAEGNLSIEHGVSYYGPATNEKIKLECERILTVKESISAKGYIPDDDINGFFMEHENDFVFFVRGGKHRAAVLGFLGYAKIPVVLRKGWPRVVSSNNSSEWSLVKSGKIDEQLSLEIFKYYFSVENF